MKSSSEQSPVMVVERSEDSGEREKEKKKNKRRSNRRSKQNSPIPVLSSQNDLSGESSVPVGNGGKTRCYASSTGCSSSKQLEFDGHLLSEHEPTTVSRIAFSSMPTMLVNEQQEDLLLSGPGGSMLAKSCTEPVVGGGPPWKIASFSPVCGSSAE
ncbi:hypothetical protein OIU74_010493 [Salix koriyanagi]|uniref:Uncharacterized protein n=1 Tax=Salix koriyanagi TaxID=2511006 RepID=A0A9Q0TD34_9ROSI|nr:hypothetical protein OIU74_010493 [Salix koriyanagi]